MLQKNINIASILEAIKAMEPIEGDVILLLFGEKRALSVTDAQTDGRTDTSRLAGVGF